jgi:hypothetical protein
MEKYPTPNIRPLKWAIWLYFWLLLFEGVLRKWIFPEWSDVLFIIRDPLVVIIYLLAVRLGMFPQRLAVLAVGLLAVASLAFTLANDSLFVVTLFGLRTNYLHVPLVFVMAQTLDRDDVLRFGRWVLLMSVPIILLMWQQFEAEPDHWLNAGVSGTTMGQLRGAMGRIRPPGPFSFIGGVVAYFALVAAFVFNGWLQQGTFPRLLVWVATVAVAAAVPLSVSRSVLFALLVVAMFGLAVAARDLRRVRAYLGPLVASAAVLGLAADSIYMEAFRTRWEESISAGSGDFSTNVVGRIIGEFTQPFELAAGAPLFGHGIGVGTIAGARLSTGKHEFILAESELARIVLELGPVLGFAFIAWRVWLAATMVWSGWRKYLGTGDPLSWLLAGSCFLAVLVGQWGPATQLGFAVFGAGLTLAAQNDPPGDAGEMQAAEEEEASADS